MPKPWHPSPFPAARGGSALQRLRELHARSSGTAMRLHVRAMGGTPASTGPSMSAGAGGVCGRWGTRWMCHLYRFGVSAAASELHLALRDVRARKLPDVAVRMCSLTYEPPRNVLPTATVTGVH